MAMLPFCGYNMADYFTHWLNIGRRVANPPRIFRVNWFRKDDNGKFLWPGFGENMRVLKWIVDRVQGRGFAVESPYGWMPRHDDIEWKGLDFKNDTFYELMSVSRSAGRAGSASPSQRWGGSCRSGFQRGWRVSQPKASSAAAEAPRAASLASTTPAS